MSWNSIIGQPRAKEILQRSVELGRIAHAYLLWGPRGTGKDALAIEFAKTLLCERQGTEACGSCRSCIKVGNLQHPNVRLIFALPAAKPEKNGDNGAGRFSSDVRDEIRAQLERKARNPYYHIEIPKATQINIGSIREVKKESSMSAYERGRKIFVVSDADLMNEASANSLLKVLEEPLSDTLFLLTTSRKEKLLPTIVSRCQSVRCEPLRDDEIEGALRAWEKIPDDEARVISRLATGDYSRALEFLGEDLTAQRRESVAFLRAALGGRSAQLIDTVEGLLADNDRGGVDQYLSLLLVWLRDALVLKERGEDGLINRDQRDELTRFVARFGNANLPASIGAVEKALELLRGNVYLPLVMFSLAVQLKRILSNVE